MLATLMAKAFDKPGWIFEEKYDGDRLLAYKEGDHVRLLSRNQKDRTGRQSLVRTKAALVNPPRGKGLVFVAPRLVAKISFQEWTADGKLRQPVFLGLRDDKRPEEVLLRESKR
jgi:ATP-dependent DNA ligase